MPEIPEIGIGAVQVPEIPAWRAMPPQSIPVEPPITLQIGFPVADIPGCVQTRNSAAGDAKADCLFDMPFIAQEKSGDHLGVSGWIVVMSFRSEAFSLDFCHIKFWRGCLWFLVKRR